jgi:D-glycero-alpha-D-manno-heptose 1-phosphate guanylyltransferase
MQNSINEAIVFAGGLGTRLKSEVSDRPKILADVNGRAFIEYILDQLIELKITRVIFALGFKSEQVIEYFKNGYKGLDIDFSIEDEPLGTGGALVLASKNAKQERFLVLNGDSYCSFNQNSLCIDEDFVLFALELEDCSRYGSLEISDGYLTSFKEKTAKQKGFINAGIYIVSKDLLKNVPKNRKISLEKEIIPEILKTTKIKVETISANNFIDIGTPEDYKKAMQMF